MKIAFLTPEYPNAKTGSSGGIGTSIKNLAEGLIQKGCSVRVLVYGQSQDSIFEDNGLIIQQIKNIKLKGFSWYFTRKKIQKIINNLYNKNEIQLVEAPDWTGITSFIRPKKCPIVIRLNGSDTYFCHLDQRPVKVINKFHEKRALKNANFHIAVSAYTAQITNQLFKQDIDYTIIPNCIVSDNEAKSNFENKHKILYFGTLIRKKGLLELPMIFNKVIEKNPLATLLLVGRDAPDIITNTLSTWQLMQPLFSQAALNKVQYLGEISHNEIKHQIQKVTLCVFPTFAEALPVSWLEAMDLSKPIVASNIGWASEIVDDGIDGLLANPKEHEKFAENILKILENYNLQKTIGDNARQKIELKFNTEVVTSLNYNFYENSIKKWSKK